MFRFHIGIVVLGLAVAGCTHAPAGVTTESPVTKGIDGVPCVGTINSPPPGLAEYRNPALLEQSQRATGQGYLCSATSYAVTAPVRLYRLVDSTDRYAQAGRFWAFDRPTGTRDDYRAKFAICKEWNPLDRLISCEVRAGTVLVVGTTQSADCSQGIAYEKTAANQVFVPNDGLAGISHVAACKEEGAWPPTSN